MKNLSELKKKIEVGQKLAVTRFSPGGEQPTVFGEVVHVQGNAYAYAIEGRHSTEQAKQNPGASACWHYFQKASSYAFFDGGFSVCHGDGYGTKTQFKD